MTSTTDFIAELIRAANSPARLTPHDKRNLLKRGRSTAVALRGLILKTGKPVPIEISSSHAGGGIPQRIENASDQTVSRAILAIAEEIRKLRIINHGVNRE